MAIVYVLTNPAFENYVKVGITTNLEKRLRDLDSTSVPLPFRCVFAVEVEDAEGVEHLVHEAFGNVRVRPRREFFEIDAQKVIAALKLTNGEDVTPKSDIAEDKEGVEALYRTIGKRRSRRSFAEAHAQVGDVLTYVRDEDITATIVTNKEIEFEDKKMSLSGAALILLRREGYEWEQVNGFDYWVKDGETMKERADRFSEEKDENG